ncbi:MAG: thioesterase family protein [Anaerolineae bacterium]
MPLTTELLHQVAYHECDVYQIVRDACYLRTMQEAAFAASTAVGYDDARYQTMRRVWLIRESLIDFIQPLRYGDQVRIRTWVADFRRVRSRRAYELRRVADDALMARASTEWAFLDRDTGRPTLIPDALIADFTANYRPDAALERERFPAAPPAPPGVCTLRHPVQWRDLDSVGHVNNAAYGDLIENAGRQAASQRGWPASRMAAVGFDLATQRLRIEYRQPALPGDELEVATWLSELAADGALRHTTVRRVADGELLAQGVARWRCVDLHSRAPLPTPPDFMVAMQANQGGSYAPSTPS